MPRRVSLPAADDLFRPTARADEPSAPPSAAPGAADDAEQDGRKKPSGRVRHDEKMTVYITSDELLDLEHARLVLRRWSQGERFVRAATVPFRVLVLVVALFAVVQAVRGHDPDDWWWDAAVAVCRVLAIGAGTWLLAAVVVGRERV